MALVTLGTVPTVLQHGSCCFSFLRHRLFFSAPCCARGDKQPRSISSIMPLSQVLMAAAGTLEVKVRNAGSSLCSVVVDSSWTLKQLKTAVKTSTGVPECEQRCLADTVFLRTDEALQELLAQSATEGFLELTLVRQPEGTFAPDWYPEGKYTYKGKDVLRVEDKFYASDYGGGSSSRSIRFTDGSCEEDSNSDMDQLTFVKEFGFRPFERSETHHGTSSDTVAFTLMIPPEHPDIENWEKFSIVDRMFDCSRIYEHPTEASGWRRKKILPKWFPRGKYILDGKDVCGITKFSGTPGAYAYDKYNIHFLDGQTYLFIGDVPGVTITSNPEGSGGLQIPKKATMERERMAGPSAGSGETLEVMMKLVQHFGFKAIGNPPCRWLPAEDPDLEAKKLSASWYLMPELDKIEFLKSEAEKLGVPYQKLGVAFLKSMKSEAEKTAL